MWPTNYAAQVAFVCDLLSVQSNGLEALRLMHGGHTNAVYLFDSRHVKAVVRVFGPGTERVIDRQAELANIREAGHIPVLATFQGGLVLGYTEGRSAEVEELSDPTWTRRIAVAVALFHQPTLGRPHGEELIGRTRRFLAGVRNHEAEASAIAKIIEDFEERVPALRNRPLALCHCDLLAGNVLLNSADDSVAFIDYEYSCWTWPAFDIANHFFERCGFECELSRFPSRDEQVAFIRDYLGALGPAVPDVTGAPGGSVAQGSSLDERAEIWRDEVELFQPLSGALWAAWGLFQAENSEIAFDYETYARRRIALASTEIFMLSRA